MIVFKKKGEEIYLVKNYKVMFSSLTKQDHLHRIYFSNRLFLKMWMNKVYFNKVQFYLLVRDPYLRSESFFKNKFRSTLPNIVKLGKWQHCHEIFFRHIGITKDVKLHVIANKLSLVSFSDFVSLLPKVYKKDGHLHPQCWSLKKEIKLRSWLTIKLPMRYKNVFKLESERDIEIMANLFKLNLEIKINSSKMIDAPIYWKRDEINIVTQIYKADLKRFNYKRKIEANTMNLD